MILKMSKQYAVIPLNFDVLTFSDKSLEKYWDVIEKFSTDYFKFNLISGYDLFVCMEKLKMFYSDRDSYFLVPMGENYFTILLKENAKQFIDKPDCEFSITRRE